MVTIARKSAKMLVNREAPDWEGLPLEQRPKECREQQRTDEQMDVQDGQTSWVCGMKSGTKTKHNMLPCIQNSRTILMREITRIIFWE